MAHSVLLTGGAGFIGSHTAVELLAEHFLTMDALETASREEILA